ncbi:6453_t:CDS:2 [Diversispora eburnea]|uniref:6453_t:CDS:1 n=1 Tax=Diversispora eburnea TaxID=1213867 RepID=A0A9N8ZW87_9GLOM|nr:6453_t:CDS:2 [Diversispora eburnea]
MRKSTTGATSVNGNSKPGKLTSVNTPRNTKTSLSTSNSSNSSTRKSARTPSPGKTTSKKTLSPNNISPPSVSSKPTRAAASPSIKDAIAQARLRKANNKSNKANKEPEESEGGSKGLNVIVKQAKTSGRINISHRSLKNIPEEVWRMYEVDPKAITIDFSGGGGSDVWYETVDLVRMVAADNQLESIDKRIAEFISLAYIDFHNNHLSSLPDEFGELQKLELLNLSVNQFAELPNCITKLSSLVELQLASNNLSGTMDPCFGNFSKLELLDISSNEITGLPKELKNLTNLRKLNIAKNKIKEIPGFALSNMKNLEELEASENQLNIVFSGLNGQTIFLPALKRLDVRQNKLRVFDESQDSTVFHPMVKLPKLKELLISLNRIESFGPLFHNTLELEILDIGDNNLKEIPEGLIALKGLKRLDLSNNDLKILPAELGMLKTLDFLGWEGNPLRNAPKGLKSTAALLKTLRDRLTTVDFENMEGPTIPESSTSVMLSANHVREEEEGKIYGEMGKISQQGIKSRTLDLARKNLTNLPEDDMNALPFEPSTVLLGYNLFQSIPIGFRIFQNSIKYFQFDHNKFIEFPMFEDKSIIFPNVDRLDLSANQITSLPDSSQSTPFPNLQVLNVNNCRITALPEKLPFPHLKTFLVTSNALTAITPSTFENMEVIDISNNNIGFLPPGLGNITTIKTLLVEGNSFRVPRYTIVQAGTAAIMEHLRGRIPRS